ncbi:MAG: glycerol-3-phosphate dehydrogenase/oxidase [Candidatus Eisenbacteria bacterium]
MPTVDLLVIGGGVHGAAVARDAALRGLSVVLAEKDDLASGTSSRSSKLAHGGIRYLETRQFGLVREALAERSILLRTAPDFVRPLPFVLPFYPGDERPAWKIKIGLKLYDAFARAKDLPPHRLLSPAEALALEPSLPAPGLKGAALYHDAQVDDALLVVANAVAAARAGADVRTRCEVRALEPAGAGPQPTWRALLSDDSTVEARVVVNAAGPWLDVVRGRAGLASPPSLRPTRGAHIVVPAITLGRALLLFARRDHRVFFVLPWGSRSLVGTTDTDVGLDQDPDAVAPTADDVRYLWDEIAARWPDHPAARDPLAATRRVFAGLRPLARTGSGKPWDHSREARLLDERGLISLAGGKYTTARHLAERAVDRAVRHLRRPAAPCATAELVLPGPSGPLLSGARSGWLAQSTETTGTNPDLARADVELAIEYQFARGVGDVLLRRSALWLDAHAIRAAAPRVAGWMAERLGWTPETRAREVADVLAQLEAEDGVRREAAACPRAPGAGR